MPTLFLLRPSAIRPRDTSLDVWLAFDPIAETVTTREKAAAIAAEARLDTGEAFVFVEARRRRKSGAALIMRPQCCFPCRRVRMAIRAGTVRRHGRGCADLETSSISRPSRLWRSRRGWVDETTPQHPFGGGGRERLWPSKHGRHSARARRKAVRDPGCPAEVIYDRPERADASRAWHARHRQARQVFNRFPSPTSRRRSMRPFSPAPTACFQRHR